MEEFKRGQKVNFKGNKQYKAVNGTYIWAVNDHMMIGYYIQHPDGVITKEKMAHNGGLPDGFESPHSKYFKEGLKYIFVSSDELEKSEDFELTTPETNIEKSLDTNENTDSLKIKLSGIAQKYIGMIPRDLNCDNWSELNLKFADEIMSLDEIADSIQIKKDNEKLLKIIDSLKNMSEDSGREGCNYGDTEYDSLSAVYGYNLCLSNVKEMIK